MDAKGITQIDLYKLFSDHCITDEEIFTVSHYLNDNKNRNIFFTKIIGILEVRVRFFEIEVVYDIIRSRDNKRIASISVNFDNESLFVEFPDIKLEIGLDLYDYPNRNKETVLYARMQLLNELLTRYYSRILYSIYQERRR